MEPFLQTRPGRSPGRAAAAVLAAALLGWLGLATAASATTVQMTVEAAGAPAPLFAGPVATAPHPVDGGDGSGAHPCDGPAGAPASATATGALDDAMRAAGIPWRGSWDPSFRDFFIDRIGAYASAAPDDYWSLTVNGRYAPGGCLAALAEGDSVRFYFGPLFGEGPGVEGANGSAGGGGASGGPGASNGGASSGHGVRAGSATPARVRAIASGAAHYLRRHPRAAGSDWGRLALALRTDRASAPPSGRVDGATTAGAAAAILGDRLEHRRGNGSVGGETNATALAVIALEPSPPHLDRPHPLRRLRAARRAAAWLARAQLPSGGFGYRPGVPADVDSSGLAAWALARAGRLPAVHRAAAFVAAAQNPDGGFPSLPGGESNSQSTGMALLALRLGGAGPRLGSPSPLDYLASLARPDGSLEYAPNSRPTPGWTTAQALLGLSPRVRLLR